MSSQFRRSKSPSGLITQVKRIVEIPVHVIWVIFNRGPIGAYRRIHGGDLAAMIAFNAMLALVPILLLFAAIAGLLLQDESRLQSVIINISQALPEGQTREAIRTILSARQQTTTIGLVGIVGLLWIGTSFVTTVARVMDTIYHAPERHFVRNRLQALVVVIVFAVLLIASAITAALPTYFRAKNVPNRLEEWIPVNTTTHLITYGLSLVSGILMFGILHLFLPNAGQTGRDIWPGTAAAAIALTIVTQGFPIYLRLTSNSNRYGAVFGVVWLLLTWFLLLAHILVISTIINAWHQKRLRRKTSLAPMG